MNRVFLLFVLAFLFCFQIRVYSVSLSVFVLFNVMGVVFTVVNGMCVEDQMCYYDQNKTANRLMAICLIILHCVSILLSVFLAKRAHLIDSELNTDIGIKLNHVINFLRRQRSVASIPQSEISDSKRTSPSQDSDRTEVGLSEVQNKGGHVLTTIEISAMAHRKTHRRSKSQPNMVKQLGLQKPGDVKGQVFSIYSDTEVDESDERKKKKRPSKHSHRLVKPTLSPRVRSKSENNVDNLPSDDDSFVGKDSFSQSFASNRGSIASSSSKNDDHFHRDEDILLVKSSGMDEGAYRQQKLLLKQEKIQMQQERLFEEQRKLFLVQKHVSDVTSAEGAPPPYENGDNPNYKSIKDNDGERYDVL